MLFSFLPFIAGSQGPVAIRAYRPEVKDIVASKGAYRLTVVRRSEPSLTPDSAARWWGGYDPRRHVVVDEIALLNGKARVLVPRSCYADLANVHTVSLRVLKGGCRLTLVGGDASASYTATLMVSHARVVERTVRSGEFPNDDYETTRYVVRTPKE